MKNIDSELLKLKDLLEPLTRNASFGKKAYANAVMETIITELNYREVAIGNLNSKLNGFADRYDYLTTFQKCIDILMILGASGLSIEIFRKECLDWILNNSKELKRPFTFKELISTHKMLIMFEGLNDKYPESLAELKEFWKGISE
jgi:hypothetical protein